LCEKIEKLENKTKGQKAKGVEFLKMHEKKERLIEQGKLVMGEKRERC